MSPVSARRGLSPLRAMSFGVVTLATAVVATVGSMWVMGIPLPFLTRKAAPAPRSRKAGIPVLLTARPAWVRPQTLAWLHRYGLRWDLLVMRDRGDYGAAREFKRRSVRELKAAGFDLQLSFEDDRRNVAMFHEEGVPTVYIHSGYYD